LPAHASPGNGYFSGDFHMSPDATAPISLEYLVEFTDDGNHPEPPDPQVIIIPPSTPGTDESAAAGQEPRA
jgi:hypothetical protein